MMMGRRWLLSLGAVLGACCGFKLSFTATAKLAVQISCSEVSLDLIWTQEPHLILEPSLSLYEIQWRAGKEV